MRSYFIALLACGAFLTAGCTQQSASTAPPTDPDKGPYRLEDEGQVPPLARNQIRKEVDRIDSFEEMEVADRGVSVEDVEITPEDVAKGAAVVGGGAAVVSPADPKTTKIDGFRVQVFASDDEATARSMSQSVTARLGMKTYVEAEGGMFKVRVGDCRSREEAEKLRHKCQSAGYQDAWIVMAPVIIPAGK